jgi:hypothetical protein
VNSANNYWRIVYQLQFEMDSESLVQLEKKIIANRRKRFTQMTLDEQMDCYPDVDEDAFVNFVPFTESKSMTRCNYNSRWITMMAKRAA